MFLKACCLAALALALAASLADAATVRLWRLDCGTIQADDLDLFSDTFRYAGQKKTLANSCYLIRHDDAYLLWDAGLPGELLGAPLGDGPMSATLGTTIVRQLQALGVAPGDIARLGVSHAHFDHVGQAADFPGATLLIGRADFEALAADPPPFAMNPQLLAPWRTGHAPVETVTGDRDVFGDGSVVMLAMPGHTQGSYALLVRLAQAGPVLLSGDVAIFEEQLAAGAVPSFNADRARSLASMQRLRQIAETLRATLVVQHDADDIGKLPRFPACAQ